MSSYKMIVVVITLLALGNLFGGHPGVDGATCTTASTCQATDFTLSTCTAGVCDCFNSSYSPVRTGCALKLDKPVIQTQNGESNQVISGKAFALKCIINDASTYEWYLGGTIISGQINSIYTKTASSFSDVGQFTCKGKNTDEGLKSELSDAFTVELLASSSTTSVQPTLFVPTTSVVSGIQISPECRNLPFGSTGKINYKYSDGTDVTMTTGSVTIDNTNAGKSITCEVENPSDSVTFTNFKSVAGNLPSLITNIQSVSVTYNDKIVTELVDPVSSSTFKCTISPIESYVKVSTDTLTYTWQKDGGSDIGGIISATFSPLDTGTYSCTAKLGSQTSVSSINNIKFTTNDPTAPILSTSATKPIVGGRVVLKCGDVLNEQVTYLWAKDNVKIIRQSDRKLQLDNVATTNDGAYKCVVVYLNNARVKFSKTVHITSVSTIATPTISVSGDGHLAEKGDYILTCNTDSETIGMTYEWTFAGKTTSVTGKYYSLPAVTSSINGDYTCKAKFNSAASDSSAIKTITVTNPGLECDQDNFCIAAKTGYTGICDKNDRCVCADGYTAVGEECTSNSGVMQIVGSVLIVTVASLPARFI